MGREGRKIGEKEKKPLVSQKFTLSKFKEKRF